MRKTMNKIAYTVGALLLGTLTIGQARAVSVTQTGSFGSDNQIYTYVLNLPTAQTVDIYTTSYGGGMNLDKTISQAGGFLPALTVFSASTGMVVDCAAMGLTCNSNGGTQMTSAILTADPMTGLVNDAFLRESLNAGSYIIDLTEVPNVANGDFNSNPQFLFSNDATATGDVCGVSGGTFLETDMAPCAQRNGNFTLNIGTVPEPASFWLALPVLAFGLIGRNRIFSRS
jgi:hypothetical protein